MDNVATRGPGSGAFDVREVWTPALRIALGIFFLFKGLGKVRWLAESSLLASRLQTWLEEATPLNRWYVELLLPGVPVLARLVVIGELGLAASLIAGLWTRPVALLGFLMVLNFHLATGELFQYEFLLDGSGLPVLGGLLALGLGGGSRALCRVIGGARTATRSAGGHHEVA
jgi:uncharacterized membrane protein YphA (DoxX/SURF4 family)